VGWGEERLRAAHRTLAALPAFPLAHWLAATVYVGRQAPAEAERELASGLAALTRPATGDSRFSGLALHWLLGLLHLSRGDDQRALAEFQRELATEPAGHLYARECAANTWYAIGALHLGRGRQADAAAAFDEALRRVPRHPMAWVCRQAARTAATELPHLTVPEADLLAPVPGLPRFTTVEFAMARAASLVLSGAHAEAARLVETALATAPPGPAGWLLPIEPVLQVFSRQEIWAGALANLRHRAA
jgi:tetratricopeptide (TPR) repeat protein